MAAKYYNVEGECSYAFVQEPTTKYNSDEREYAITVKMDPEYIEIFKNSGSQKKLRDGDTIKLQRDLKKTFNGVEKELGPLPLYFGPEGKETSDALVGNGSRVRVNFVVYDTPKGKGTRLEGVRVLDLVEFVPEQKELPF